MTTYFSGTDTTYTKLNDLKDLPSYSASEEYQNLALDTKEQVTVEDGISSQYRDFKRQDIAVVEKTKSNNRNWFRLVAHACLIIGIALLVLAIVFKVESRSHINTAIENKCPASCVTTCYANLPLYKPSIDCGLKAKQMCDQQCNPVGMNSAKTYEVLFLVFVSLGGFFILVQLVYSCVKYCCLDYLDEKKKQEIK